MRKYKLSPDKRKKGRERQRKFREDRKTRGLVEVRLAVHPEDREQVKRYAQGLLERRLEGEGI